MASKIWWPMLWAIIPVTGFEVTRGSRYVVRGQFYGTGGGVASMESTRGQCALACTNIACQSFAVSPSPTPGMYWCEYRNLTSIPSLHWTSMAVPEPFSAVLRANGDNLLESLWVDGVNITLPFQPKHWMDLNLAYTHPTHRPLVLAVEALGQGIWDGLMAMLGEDIYTDHTWRCTHVYEAGWQGVGFDDTHWPAAVVLGRTGNSIEAKYPDGAVWIWSPAGVNTRCYCRKTIV